MARDEFVKLLAAHNRQRVKTLDVVAREEAVLANPEEPYRVLTEYRARRPDLCAEPLVIDGVTRRARITAAKMPFLQAIRGILDGLRSFWPLTDRQVHYNLLNDPPLKHAGKPEVVHRRGQPFSNRYCNDRPSYKALCELLTRARLAGLVPWEAIEDATRPVCTWDVWDSPAPFIRRQMDGLLKGYYRNLQRSQPDHIEIVGEKNTIEGVIRPVAMEFCIPYTIGRGYSSLDPRRKMFERFRKSGKGRLVLLTLSDFDAEGDDIPVSFARSMRDDFGIGEVYPVRVALTPEQVRAHSPHPSRLKKKSSRAKKFRERYGEETYELEAIPPQALQQYLRDKIDAVLDPDALNAEVEREKQEAAYLDVLRRRTFEALGPLGV
jgi:hypothetical protein